MDLITTRALHDSGLTRHEIARRVRTGTIIRLKRGHYLPKAELTSLERHLLMVDTMPTATLALESAALVHGLPVESIPERVQTIVAGTGRTRQRERRTVLTGRLADADTTWVEGVRVTTPERTVVDITRLRGLDEGLVPWEAARWRARVEERLEEFDAAIADALGRLEKCRGVALGRRGLQRASAWSQSPMETRSRLIMARGEVPTPVQQFPVHNGRGVLLGVSDFAWPDLGLLGEYDGLDKYEYLARPGESPLDVMRREKARQEAMEAEGYLFVRWGKEEVVRPVRLLARLRQAFETARRRPFRGR